MAPTAPVTSLRGVCKAFMGVQALAGVDFDLRPGEVHALLGENGAGKSTLMKVLFGVVRPDAGEIVLDGRPLHTLGGPRPALGIGLVSQELSLVPQLDVAQNIFLGQARAWHPVQRQRQQARAAALLHPLAPEIDVAAPVAALGMAARQVVEIARTLARGGRINAFDEPTSSLTSVERDRLLAIIGNLKGAGRGIVYISHRMPEIYAIADRITVLRDGRVVAEGKPKGFPPDELNGLIAGRRLTEEQGRSGAVAAAPLGAETLRLERVANGRLRGIDLTVRRGEILRPRRISWIGAERIGAVHLRRRSRGERTHPGGWATGRDWLACRGARRRHRADPRGPARPGAGGVDGCRAELRSRQ